MGFSKVRITHLHVVATAKRLPQPVVSRLSVSGAGLSTEKLGKLVVATN